MPWFLKKMDNTVYGPVELDDLKDWAAQGRVHLTHRARPLGPQHAQDLQLPRRRSN